MRASNSSRFAGRGCSPLIRPASWCDAVVRGGDNFGARGMRREGLQVLLVLGELGVGPFRIDLADDLGGAVEHHLELAHDRDELPALLGSPDGVGRGEHVESARSFWRWAASRMRVSVASKSSLLGEVPSAVRIE